MAFIALDEGLRFLDGNGIVAVSDQFLLTLYPFKVLSVALTLYLFRKNYNEIKLADISSPFITLISIVTGLAVFTMWIYMDFPFVTMGHSAGFNPNYFHDYTTRIFMIVWRLFGAVLVVPVMEELFWRSFIIRYIVAQDFSKVPIGLFTWPSFLISSVLFGLEHHLFLAGIMAGVVYNLILYFTRNISQCIIAHAITNLALGVYVICSGKWYFW